MGLTVEAAIAGLVQMSTRTLEMETPTLEQPGDEGPSLIARVRFEVRCVRIIFRQLEHLLANLSTIPLYRRAQVELVHLVALLGEGVLALDSLVYHILALDAGVVYAEDSDQNVDSHIQRTEEAMNALWRLQDFRTSMWLYLNVLQSPDATDIPDTLESLDTAASCLLGGDSEVAKRLRTSDCYATWRLKNDGGLIKPELGHYRRKLTLADLPSVARAAVPVYSGDLLDPLPYSFESEISFESDADAHYSSDSSDSSSDSPIPTPTSSPPPSPRDHGRHASTHTMPVSRVENMPPSIPAGVLEPGLLDPYSCAVIFHLDITTPNMVLCFFQHALAISPRFKTHELPDIFSPPDPLELVRQQKAKQKAHPSDTIVAKFRLHNLSNTIYMASCSAADEEAVQTRLEKQQKLRGLSDHQLRCLCVEVYDELVRRNIVDNRLKALVDCTKGGYDGYLVGGPDVRQEDVEVPPVAGPSSSRGLESSSAAGGHPWGNKTLAGMEDGMFLELCADACWEEKRRDVEEADADMEAAATGKGKGKVESVMESRLQDDSGTDGPEVSDYQEEDYEYEDDELEGSEVEYGDASELDDHDKLWQRQGARRRETDALVQARFLENNDDDQDEEKDDDNQDEEEDDEEENSEEDDDDYQDGSQSQSREETTDEKEAERATTQEEASLSEVKSEEASDLDDVEEIWERHSAQRREREREALRERFLLEKGEIETVVLKYERRPEFVIYDDSGA